MFTRENHCSGAEATEGQPAWPSNLEFPGRCPPEKRPGNPDSLAGWVIVPPESLNPLKVHWGPHSDVIPAPCSNEDPGAGLRLHSLFLKGAQSLLCWGGDRQTDMHSLAFQTSHARTSTRRTFILRTDYGGCGWLVGPRRGNQTRGEGHPACHQHSGPCRRWGSPPLIL